MIALDCVWPVAELECEPVANVRDFAVHGRSTVAPVEQEAHDRQDQE